MDNDNGFCGFAGKGTRDSAWATWNVCLWVDNTEPVYRAKMRTIRSQACVNYITADLCKTFCDSWFPEGTSDMKDNEYEDICWEEVADNWQEEFLSDENYNRSDEENTLRKNLGLEPRDDLEDDRIDELVTEYAVAMDRDDKIDFIVEHMKEDE